jgi:hypothetical protein
MAEVVLFHHTQGLTPRCRRGFSLGVLPAQQLAQNRPGARGAVLCYSCVPVAEFGSGWPAAVHPGDQHYFAESSLPSYDPDAAALLTERVLTFLQQLSPHH